MGKFGLSAIDHTTAASQAILPAINADFAAGEEGEIVEIIATGGGTTGAADTEHIMRGTRSTNATAGTSTAQTAQQFNLNGNAAQAAGAVLYTVIPAVLDTIHEVMFGFNQRGGMRWAVPRGEGVDMDGDQSKGSYAVSLASSAAGKVDANMHWWEP